MRIPLLFPDRVGAGPDLCVVVGVGALLSSVPVSGDGRTTAPRSTDAQVHDRIAQAATVHRLMLWTRMTSDSPRPSGPTVGILLFSVGIFFFALNDALGKLVVAHCTVQQLLLVRSVGAGAVLVPFTLARGEDLRLKGQWGLHALRVACMTADSFAFYFSTKFLPLADVMTFYLAAPLLITAMSGPLLGERVGAFRWGAVVVGFIGVVLALRPSGAAISPPALIALGGSAMFACAMTTTRKLRDTPWLSLVAWQVFGSGLVGAALSPVGWVTPGALDVALMALIGIVSMACFVCVTWALQRADASVVAPFQYVSIVWAGTLGWLIWGDVPDRNTALGIVIIVGSGLAVWWREQRSAGPTVAAVPAP